MVQTQAAPAVTVTMEEVVTPRKGATGQFGTKASRTVSVGGHFVAGFVAGDRDDEDLCLIGTVPGAEIDRGHVRWRVEATVEAADPHTVTLAVAWQRWEGDGAEGKPVVVKGDQRTIRLRPDDVHVLDLVQADPGSSSSCANVLIRVRAARAEPPILIRKWLTYDLWLVYEGPPGAGATRHLEVSGAEDAPLSFEFPPLRWGLNGARTAATSTAGVALAASGTLLGRCRPDGAVDVSLLTHRSFAFAGRTASGSGSKQFVLSSDDTTAVEIPNPSARFSTEPGRVIAAPPPWAPGIEATADGLTVKFGEFFQNSRLRLLVSGRCE
jgi:hypothetical protein